MNKKLFEEGAKVAASDLFRVGEHLAHGFQIGVVRKIVKIAPDHLGQDGVWVKKPVFLSKNPAIFIRTDAAMSSWHNQGILEY